MVSGQDNIVNFKLRRESRSQALERLYNEHGDALRTYLLGRMGDSSDIEDIVHEVFIRLSRMNDLAERAPADRKNNRAYIFTIANNLIVDLARHKKVSRSYEETERGLAGEKQCDASPEVLAQDHQMLRQVEKALSKLPPLWRKAFVLSRFEYMSHKEIGLQLGLAPRSVERYIGKALARLRKAAGKSKESGR